MQHVTAAFSIQFGISEPVLPPSCGSWRAWLQEAGRSMYVAYVQMACRRMRSTTSWRLQATSEVAFLSCWLRPKLVAAETHARRFLMRPKKKCRIRSRNNVLRFTACLFTVTEKVCRAQPWACQAEEAEEEELPEDLDNDTVEAQALFELGVEVGPAEEGVQRHFGYQCKHTRMICQKHAQHTCFGLCIISDQPAASLSGARSKGRSHGSGRHRDRIAAPPRQTGASWWLGGCSYPSLGVGEARCFEKAAGEADTHVPRQRQRAVRVRKE